MEPRIHVTNPSDKDPAESGRQILDLDLSCLPCVFEVEGQMTCPTKRVHRVLEQTWDERKQHVKHVQR